MKYLGDWWDDAQNFENQGAFVSMTSDDDTFYTDFSLTAEEVQVMFTALHEHALKNP